MLPSHRRTRVATAALAPTANAAAVSSADPADATDASLASGGPSADASSVSASLTIHTTTPTSHSDSTVGAVAGAAPVDAGATATTRKPPTVTTTASSIHTTNHSSSTHTTEHTHAPTKPDLAPACRVSHHTTPTNTASAARARLPAAAAGSRDHRRRAAGLLRLLVVRRRSRRRGASMSQRARKAKHRRLPKVGGRLRETQAHCQAARLQRTANLQSTGQARDPTASSSVLKNSGATLVLISQHSTPSKKTTHPLTHTPRVSGSRPSS